LIKILRNNCPWDRKQTIDTLKKHIKEESDEVIETDDMEKLEEELGDLFLVITIKKEVKLKLENLDLILLKSIFPLLMQLLVLQKEV